MSTTTDLSTLKINYLTQAQYDEALEDGDINQNELYFTPDTGDAGAHNVWYGKCSTIAGTQTKVVTTTTGDFTLTNGNIVVVYFENANSVLEPQLNVDGTGARYLDSDSPNANTWDDYGTKAFVYDNTLNCFEEISGGVATTATYGLTKLSSSVSSTSTVLAATSSAVKQAYDLANGKQDALVSGTNIKTVNSTSILGSGNVAVQPTLVSGTNIKTVNNESLLGSGNVSIQGGTSVSTVQVSITVANWNATTTVTKSVTGVTASNSIIVSPTPASIADYVDSGVYCSAQGSGTLTFVASSTPTANLTINVMIVG